MSKLYNTLTKQNNTLDKKNINIYICGPTVYDHSHIGHARTYITFDIIRNILTNYFKYNIHVTMNITNVDDKIINRTNENNKDKQLNFEDYLNYAKIYEESFFEDLMNLNVSKPNVITRVSDYIDEIILFINKIIENKYAYESNQSIYFDTAKFKEEYPELSNPFNLKDTNDDKFKINDYANKKKNKQDFVLWKAKKSEQEPSWNSPWGIGRPGWHIECSAMCHSINGDHLDIHCGGIDLQFPHHNNEILQTHAYTLNNWTDHFMHFGHLNIQGLKMSKSLKNFITIKEILNKYTPNQLRLLFLMHDWHTEMEYNESSMEYIINLDKRLVEFIDILNFYIKRQINDNEKYNDQDKQTNKLLEQLKSNIDNYLIDNINTKQVIIDINDFMSYVYNYIKDKPKSYVLNEILKYVNFILLCFGYKIKENNNNEVDKFIDVIANIRQDIRNITQNVKDNETKNKLFALTDNIRDKIMPKLNIQITDDGKDNNIWRSIL